MLEMLEKCLLTKQHCLCCCCFFVFLLFCFVFYPHQIIMMLTSRTHITNVTEENTWKNNSDVSLHFLTWYNMPHILHLDIRAVSTHMTQSKNSFFMLKKMQKTKMHLCLHLSLFLMYVSAFLFLWRLLNDSVSTDMRLCIWIHPQYLRVSGNRRIVQVIWSSKSHQHSHSLTHDKLFRKLAAAFVCGLTLWPLGRSKWSHVPNLE